jgi:hypothetical protein
LSQRKFALWCGLDVMTVSRWANNRRRVPQYGAILATLVARLPEVAILAKEQRLP